MKDQCVWGESPKAPRGGFALKFFRDECTWNSDQQERWNLRWEEEQVQKHRRGVSKSFLFKRLTWSTGLSQWSDSKKRG